MKISTVLRIFTDQYWKRSFRETYWKLAAMMRDAVCLFFNKDADLRKYVWTDLGRYLFRRVGPIAGESRAHAEAAANWLLRAQDATPDDGVSLGYFPCDGIYNGWRPSYPETTGYIMSTLFEFAKRFGNQRAHQAAINMGRWEIALQMPSGAIQGGPVTSPDRQTPAAFNTGMVLDGWCAAYEATKDSSFLEAARKAADFLVNDLDENGYYKTNGEFVSSGEIKTYTCLCAWAIYRFGILADSELHRRMAIHSIEGALRQQQDNGWFGHNCLTYSLAPLTHTIGYTLQGVLEVGLLSGREDFVLSVRKGIDPVLRCMAPNGYLAGRFYADWEPAGFYSCLTGSAQIAVVCYRLARHTGVASYAESADRLVNFLKSLQSVDSPVPGFNGALPGSFPLLGDYMRAGCPNWATKYFLDALLLQEQQVAPV